MHLPLDVVGHALWKLGQILLVLKYRSHHLKHTEIIKKIGCCLGEPDPVYGTHTALDLGDLNFVRLQKLLRVAGDYVTIA